MSEREMPAPGAARDALIAELVFGWTLCPDVGHGGYGWHRHQAVLGFSGWLLQQLSPWSTDDKAALDVLMEMQRQGWDAKFN